MLLNSPTTAITSPSASTSSPSFRTAAVCEFTQYAQPLVALTASAMISRVSGSSFDTRPHASGCMIALSRVHTSSRWSGLVASTRHRFGTEGIFLVALMSAKIAATLPVAAPSDTGVTVAIRPAIMASSPIVMK